MKLAITTAYTGRLLSILHQGMESWNNKERLLEAYSKPYQTCKLDASQKLAKSSTLDIWKGSEYAYECAIEKSCVYYISKLWYVIFKSSYAVHLK